MQQYLIWPLQSGEKQVSEYGLGCVHLPGPVINWQPPRDGFGRKGEINENMNEWFASWRVQQFCI